MRAVPVLYLHLWKYKNLKTTSPEIFLRVYRIYYKQRILQLLFYIRYWCIDLFLYRMLSTSCLVICYSCECKQLWCNVIPQYVSNFQLPFFEEWSLFSLSCYICPTVCALDNYSTVWERCQEYFELFKIRMSSPEPGTSAEGGKSSRGTSSNKVL